MSVLELLGDGHVVLLDRRLTGGGDPICREDLGEVYVHQGEQLVDLQGVLQVSSELVVVLEGLLVKIELLILPEGK